MDTGKSVQPTPRPPKKKKKTKRKSIQANQAGRLDIGSLIPAPKEADFLS